MAAFWVVVAAVGVGTVALKATGPVLLGGRELGPRVAAAVSLLAPALLAALVVTQGFGVKRGIVVDARAIGLAVAAVAIWLRLPLLAVVVAAAVATALARLL